LPRIEGLDLSLFDFDLDLTLMMFFLSADDKVYARYGGRDGHDADNRQSLPGLRYTMESVLAMHRSENKVFAPRAAATPKFAGMGFGGKGGKGCIHCHQAKEREADFKRSGTLNRDLIYRYPLPDNLGVVLEVNRGNIVKSVKANSTAAAAGLQTGDRIRDLAGVPIHSFGDAQWALDRARKQDTLAVSWQRDDRTLTAKLTPPAGWQKTDLSWRHSVRRLVPSPRLDGKDLNAEERKTLGLSATQLAYRLRTPLHPQARSAGFQEGDIILGLENAVLEASMNGFYDHVALNYLVGDRVVVTVLRDGKRLSIPLTFGR
jgi:hypothetical protein